MKSLAIAKRIAEAASSRGWRAYIIGGFVRDKVLGIASKDIDMEVFGPPSMDSLINFARQFGEVDLVGESFSVIKLKVPGENAIDLSLPRRDSKTSTGHRGFTVISDGSMTMEEASLRRDFTFNAMFLDPITDEIIDFYCGLLDLKEHTLHRVSRHFVDDPLRVLRGMQQCAIFNLTATYATVFLCRSLKSEFHTLPKERIWEEWHKWSTRSTVPSRALVFLHRTEWLDFFPALKALLRLPQDARFHREGSIWNHTKLCIDRAVTIAKRENLNADDTSVLLFAALLHDAGKPSTTVILDSGKITTYGHDDVGADIAAQFLSDIGAPISLSDRVTSLIAAHMFSATSSVTPRTVRRLSKRLEPASIRMLCLLMEVDITSRNLKTPDTSRVDKLVKVAETLSVVNEGPKPIVMGRHLIELGLKPGKHFSPILSTAFNAQLDGTFSTLEDGIEFIQPYL